MTKICFIVVRLVPEADKEPNEKLECEIQKEVSVPWSQKILKTTVLETQQSRK